LTAVGAGFASVMDCSATFIYPVITGSILGDVAGKQEVYNCIYLFIAISGVGLVLATWLLLLGCKKEPTSEAALSVGANTDSEVTVIDAELGMDAGIVVELANTTELQDDELMANEEVEEKGR
jgi:hypothetical protein